MDLLSQMTTFVRVVEAGSLSAAGTALGLSLPAVSRQISSLEASLGVSLLLRTTRKVTVTERGRCYYEHCLRVFREVEAAQQSVQGSLVEGVVRVTAPVTFGLARVSPHLPALMVRYPGLTVDLRVEDRVLDLVGEGIDVAIRTGVEPPDSGAFIARKLTSYRRVVVASPKYIELRGEPKTPEALSAHEAILHVGVQGVAGVWRFERKGPAVEAHVRGHFRANAPYALRDAAVAGLGVALLPDWLVAEDIVSGRLRRLLRGHEVAPVVVSAVHRREVRGELRVKALLDHLAGCYQQEGLSSPPGDEVSATPRRPA